MASIKNVAVFGASGHIGPYIVRALLETDFNVTAIGRRPASPGQYPSGVITKVTDYSPESLHQVLTGQDAVISCIARSESETELMMIDAAEEVGVQRFLPSEYGVDMHGKASPEYTAMLEGKNKVQKHLQERAAANPNFTWTAVVPGPFFDYFLYAIPSLVYDIPNRKAIIYDSGNEPWTGTNIEAVSKAVANVLLHPVETANREVKIRTIQTTQNEALAELEKSTGTKWDVQRVSAEEMLRRGRESLKAGRTEEAYAFLFASQLWEDGKGRGVTISKEESDNALLGVEEEMLEDIVRRVIRENLNEHSHA